MKQISKSRVVLFGTFLLSLIAVPVSTASAQTAPGSSISICDIESDAPTPDPAYVEQVENHAAELNATSISAGDEFIPLDGSGNPAAPVRVTSVSSIAAFGDIRPTISDYRFLIICLSAEAAGSSTSPLVLNDFVLRSIHFDPASSDPASHVNLSSDAARFANEELLDNQVEVSQSASGPQIRLHLNPSEPTTFALIFEHGEDTHQYYLSEGGRNLVLVGGTGPNLAANSPTNSQSASTDSSGESSGDSFGEPIFINPLPNQANPSPNTYRLTFDPNVEVRYFIGDQSITPRRGQFLVIWFEQSTSSNEPLPMGAFELRVSTGPGEPFETYDISREGTAALILTEYDWNPEFMDDGISYRTGVVFDIRPEDTHFELRYIDPSMPDGLEVQVSITFDA